MNSVSMSEDSILIDTHTLKEGGVPRPCHCGACRLCWLADHDARTRQVWGLAGSSSVPGPSSLDPPAVVTGSVAALPCLHLTDTVPVPPPEGWLVTRSYLRCDVIGETVCRCWCNARCRGYVPDSQEEDNLTQSRKDAK